ncbi:hypothetical protein MCOR27_000805 [Pyricularia oryzae]|uniref:Methyltransferase domain-containing protein n=1 Tax=Pyricularia grisea TaxID=148305 RepID=A0ABQ8N5Z0_PYRGI|nr:hypothetical protein MCOR01_001861 [Pyricularia oryzae]KAI6291877.1 hypothetical protein MCOR33_010285 [Pyricularia grisea]KAI6272576.1 hypothetical protein MCOR26_007302 [Pyricularia oryzae]KAI6288715.1 hypothetical protein MCOR27_000805 [Pyricularia oryzae]KAI6333461.1 hypothetical protein MCOR29_001032 [Pyricularia oryzae]
MADPVQTTKYSTIPQDLKARIKQSYDVISQAYTDWTKDHAQVKLEFVNKLLDLVPGPDAKLSVLELGAGAATPVTEHVLTTLPSARVTANDMSSSQVAAGKANLQKRGFGPDRVEWHEGDMMALQFPGGTFDATLAFYSIIHLPSDEQRVIMARVFDWLKPGSYFLANFSEKPLGGAVTEKWLDHEKGWMYWSGLGAEETVRALKGVGFEIVVEEFRREDEHSVFLWIIARKPA